VYLFRIRAPPCDPDAQASCLPRLFDDRGGMTTFLVQPLSPRRPTNKPGEARGKDYRIQESDADAILEIDPEVAHTTRERSLRIVTGWTLRNRCLRDSVATCAG